VTPEDLASRFTYHAPDDLKIETHTEIRRLGRELAQELDQLLPEGREKALAVTHLEEVVFWANAAIARQR
jgi:hypothetical protein